MDCMRTMTLTTTTPACLAATVALAGCASHNTDLGPGGDVSLPALAPDAAQVSIASASSTAPSLTSLDRSHWDEQRVLVPVRTVEHTPTYVLTVDGPDCPREHGAYPDAETALLLERPSLAHAANAALGVGIAPLGIVWAPFQMIGGRWPWTVQWSPEDEFALEPVPYGRNDPQRWIVDDTPPAGEATQMETTP